MKEELLPKFRNKTTNKLNLKWLLLSKMLQTQKQYNLWFSVNIMVFAAVRCRELCAIKCISSREKL